MDSYQLISAIKRFYKPVFFEEEIFSRDKNEILGHQWTVRVLKQKAFSSDWIKFGQLSKKKIPRFEYYQMPEILRDISF